MISESFSENIRRQEEQKRVPRVEHPCISHSVDVNLKYISSKTLGSIHNL
jgi:hypothetical protein